MFGRILGQGIRPLALVLCLTVGMILTLVLSGCQNKPAGEPTDVVSKSFGFSVTFPADCPQPTESKTPDEPVYLDYQAASSVDSNSRCVVQTNMTPDVLDIQSNGFIAPYHVRLMHRFNSSDTWNNPKVNQTQWQGFPALEWTVTQNLPYSAKEPKEGEKPSKEKLKRYEACLSVWTHQRNYVVCKQSRHPIPPKEIRTFLDTFQLMANPDKPPEPVNKTYKSDSIPASIVFPTGCIKPLENVLIPKPTAEQAKPDAETGFLPPPITRTVIISTAAGSLNHCMVEISEGEFASLQSDKNQRELWTDHIAQYIDQQLRKNGYSIRPKRKEWILSEFPLTLNMEFDVYRRNTGDFKMLSVIRIFPDWIVDQRIMSFDQYAGDEAMVEEYFNSFKRLPPKQGGEGDGATSPEEARSKKDSASSLEKTPDPAKKSH